MRRRSRNRLSAQEEYWNACAALQDAIYAMAGDGPLSKEQQEKLDIDNHLEGIAALLLEAKAIGAENAAAELRKEANEAASALTKKDEDDAEV